MRSVIAGRMMLKRVMGKASFATVQDKSWENSALCFKGLYNSDVTQTYAHLKNGI